MILITEFSKQAAKHPERIAARTEHKEMTYKELSERSDRMASYLKSQAYTKGHVALFFEQGIDMIVSVFSVLKAGMTYIPLSDSFPDLRMKYILEDAHAEILVTNTRNMEKAYAVKSFLNHTIEIINIDTVDAVGEISSNDAKAFPNEIAYILYTSGSTGNPKGVMQKQENIYYYARQYAIRMNIQPGTKMTLFSSFSHDAAVIDIFSGILHGATLYPKDMREEASFHHVLAWLKQEKINIWHSVPTLYRHFCLALRGRESFHDLTHVVLGGEHVVLQDIVRFETFFDGPVLVNLYGQSESSFNSSQWIAGSSTDTPIRLGDPIEGTQVFVVNEHNEEVMPLGVGEIVIASAYIAPGYWGKPEDTTKVFDTDPELGRLYWTGDKGRLEIDGSITWMGRKDNQVKIRGYRVELAEIEHCMMGIQGIRDVAVVARDKGDEESELVAFYTITKTAVDKEIQQYMKGRLPDYMIPSYFIAMDQIPLTASGKIDRKSLQHLNIEVKNKNKYIEPRDEVEVKLALLWESLLGVGQVGIDDHFFELGGHSLKAIQLVGAIQREFGVEMGVRYIFDHPSIRELGGKVKECSEKTVEVLSPLEKKESYPVSSAQKRLYVIQNLNRNSIAYNMPMLLELRGEIDLDKVRQAIRALVMKHEVLRTSFHMERESIVQKVHDNVEPEMEYIKTTGKEHTDQVIAGWIRPFDLAKAPLMRSGVIETGDRLLLLLDMHHIISDGTTMGILAEEFVRAYAYGALEVEPIQYKEYAQWEAEQKEKGSWEKQKEYWKKEYEEEIPVLELPTDGARGKTEDNQGEKFRFEIEEETVRGLKKVASTVGGTLYMGLMAGFSILLSKYSRQEDIVVGTPIAGRRLAQVENMAGMFVNTLAIRTKPVGDKRIEDYLQEVKEKLLGAYENQDYPYEELVEEVQVNRDMIRNPLFDVMLVLQNNELKELTIPGVQITPALVDSGRVKFDISLVILEHNERLICEVEFKSQLFRRATIQSMMKYFVRILRQISEEGYKPIKEIELVDDEDRQHLMSFNQTTAPYENQATLVQLFEQQVERTPDAVAVMFREASLTYRELSEKANQFARKLRQHGVCRDQIVGIMMERSLEMVIGIYTILKAGGAYLPIDPSFPRERIEYMLTDSGTKILLTRGRKDDALPKRIQQLDLEEELSDDGDKSNLEPINHPTDLAYVIYTSGSTGRPKGVMIEHHSVINQLSWMQKKYPIGPGDTILQKTAFTFDVSVRELFWWSFQGAAVAMLEPGGEKEPAKIVEAIAAYQITTLHFVPSMLTIFLEQIKGSKESEKLVTLKRVFASGEALLPKQVESFNQLLYRKQGTELINLYGPTEATVEVSFFPCSKEEAIRVVPIGQPIDNTRFYILDKNQKMQPIGVPGELHIAGVGLARGYLNRPELTAEKFVSNPYEQGEKMYRTGDWAKWMPDGNVDYLGRIDHQVKIRGYRIELGEIESIINSQENVKGAVVLVKGDKGKPQYICAYIAMEGNEIQPIKNELRRKLPDYMLPSSYVRVEKLPVTNNGKLDRAALLKLEETGSENRVRIPPRNFNDHTIAEIWKQILGLDEVYIQDDFFEIGGSSITIIQVANRIREAFGVEVSVADLMVYKTIQELSEYILTIDSSLNGQFKNVFKINKSTSPKNIFIVHGADGNIFYYRHLAKLLEDKYSVYGIQPRGLNGEEPFPDSYFQMLHDYLKEIRMIQSEGPYILGGYCIGGYLSYDLVNIMELQGDKVTALLQLDEEAFIEDRLRKSIFLYRSILNVIEVLRKIRRKEKMFTMETFMNLIPKAKPISKDRQLEILKERNTIRKFFGEELSVRSNYAYLGFISAPTLVIKAYDNQHRLFKEELWRKMVKGSLEYYETPGDHETVLLPPYVDNVGEIVLKYLEQFE